jgi:uncharacterized membrane protein
MSVKYRSLSSTNAEVYHGMPFLLPDSNMNMTENNEGDAYPHTAKIVERNISALLNRRKDEEAKKSREERIADRVTRFTGSLFFVYLHLALFGVWIVWNLGWFGLKAFDPSFVVLAMFASVEAIFLSTFVLISQNRMNIQADKRAELDLQVSLLSEHEITKLIILVTAMAKKIGLEEADDNEIAELKKDVHPEKVMDVMEKMEEKGSR